MCSNKIWIQNAKYRETKKNVYSAPVLTDYRKGWIAVPCGYCLQCRKAMNREWSKRLMEEMDYQAKLGKMAYFVTLSYSEEALDRISKQCKSTDANTVATKGIELWRKRIFKMWKQGKTQEKTLKHYIVTELGHVNTERVHHHGIVWAYPWDYDYIIEDWEKNCGNTFTGDECSYMTINYIGKYLNKMDSDHPGFKGKRFLSPGLGRAWSDNEVNREYHRFQGEKTVTYYKNEKGWKIQLPMYYKKKLWNDEEREWLWTYMLDKNEYHFGKRGEKFNVKLKNDRERLVGLMTEENWDNYKAGYRLHWKTRYPMRKGDKKTNEWKVVWFEELDAFKRMWVPYKDIEITLTIPYKREDLEKRTKKFMNKWVKYYSKGMGNWKWNKDLKKYEEVDVLGKDTVYREVKNLVFRREKNGPIKLEDEIVSGVVDVYTTLPRKDSHFLDEKMVEKTDDYKKLTIDELILLAKANKPKRYDTYEYTREAKIRLGIE